MNTRRKKKMLLLVAIGAAVVLAAVSGGLFYTGVLSLNHPSRSRYPVRGVDVSSYQGEIDWKVLSGQGIDFAYIKATEGSGYQDGRFSYNWEHAGEYGLAVGAYHFFSFDSSGDTQADNFIAAVPKREGALPPAVDVEFYGDKAKNPPERKDADAQLAVLLRRLEAYYGKTPVLYCTRKSYESYIEGEYPDNPIWIRDVFWTPSLKDGRRWTFWQYSSRARLKGYNGREQCIDLNVFAGSREDWRAFA